MADISTYTITTYINERDAEGYESDVTFDELCAIFDNYYNNTQFTSKSHIYRYVCAKFNGRRSKENLDRYYLLSYDIDDYKGNFDELLADIDNFKDFKHIVYTTPSHTYDMPRCRIILFPTRPIKKDEYSDVSKLVASTLFVEKLYEAIEEGASYGIAHCMNYPIYVNEGSYFVYGGYQLTGVQSTRVNIPNRNNNGENNIKKRYNFLIRECDKSLILPNITEQDIINTLEQYDVSTLDYKQWHDCIIAVARQTNHSLRGFEILLNWSLTDNRIESGKYRKEECVDALAYQYQYVAKMNPTTCEKLTFSTILHRVKLLTNKNTIISKPVDLNADLSLLSDISGSKYVKIINGYYKFFPIPKEHFIDYGIDKNDKDGNEKKKIYSTSLNFEVLLAYYRIYIAYDNIARKLRTNIEFNKINENIGGGSECFDNYVLSHFKSACLINGLDKKEASFFMQTSAEKNRYNPIKDAILATKWDGISRFDAFCDTVICNSEYESIKKLSMKTFLIQALFYWLSDDKAISGRYVLILQGATHMGKSTWVRSLLPAKFSEYINGNASLDRLNDTEKLKILNYAITELAEIDGLLNAKNAEFFKSFFSDMEDVINVKYIPFPVKFRRRVVFVGTTNPMHFLDKDIGFDRFLILPCKSVNANHGLDMLQLYSEMYEKYKLTDFVLNKQERDELIAHNRNFSKVHHIDEMFYKFFEHGEDIIEELNSMRILCKTSAQDWYSCTEVLNQLGYDRTANNFQKLVKIISGILRENDYPYSKDRYKYLLKLKKGNMTRKVLV